MGSGGLEGRFLVWNGRGLLHCGQVCLVVFVTLEWPLSFVRIENV